MRIQTIWLDRNHQGPWEDQFYLRRGCRPNGRELKNKCPRNRTNTQNLAVCSFSGEKACTSIKDVGTTVSPKLCTLLIDPSRAWDITAVYLLLREDASLVSLSVPAWPVSGLLFFHSLLWFVIADGGAPDSRNCTLWKRRGVSLPVICVLEVQGRGCGWFCSGPFYNAGSQISNILFIYWTLSMCHILCPLCVWTCFTFIMVQWCWYYYPLL